MTAETRWRRAALGAGGLLVFAGLKIARDRASRNSVLTLLDGRTTGGALAATLTGQSIHQTPLPVAAEFFGGLMTRSGRVGPADRSVQKKAAPSSPAERTVAHMLTGFPRFGIKSDERRVPGRDGSIPVRIYAPKHKAQAPRPLVLAFHGGGWSGGDLNGMDWICSTVAKDLDAVVVSVDYRLSPLHPFPAGVNDCYDALLWAAQHRREIGADGERIGVMGESAGGNLAAVISLMARDEGGPTVHHQALIYPAVDLTADTRSRNVNSDAPVLDRKALNALVTSYVHDLDATSEWRLSPLHASSKRDLPPALIQVAGHDPLYDDGILYAQALCAENVSVTLTAYTAMPHGYINLPAFCREAPLALREIVAQQRRYLKETQVRR